MKNFPKIDLHRHLEGSVEPETLLHISQTWGGDLPAYELEALRPHIQMSTEQSGFQAFLSRFAIYRGFYTCSEAIEYAVCRAVQAAAADNVKYLELRYSPTHFASRGRFCECDVVAWIHSAMQRSARECGIIVVPVLTISRDYGFELAASTVDMALSLPDGFFMGLDIAGDETAFSAEPYADLFEKFRARGLGLSIHAGEACGAENVRQAIEQFGTRRIGHGIRSADDPDLMCLLKEQEVLLEICLTSNVHTGMVQNVREHPLRTLVSAGVPVCLNTDDPAISAITLSDEYALASRELGCTPDSLKHMNRCALRHAFHPEPAWLQKQLGQYWK
jgi:adenosine deaminase